MRDRPSTSASSRSALSLAESTPLPSRYSLVTWISSRTVLWALALFMGNPDRWGRQSLRVAARASSRR